MIFAFGKQVAGGFGLSFVTLIAQLLKQFLIVHPFCSSDRHGSSIVAVGAIW